MQASLRHMLKGKACKCALPMQDEPALVKHLLSVPNTLAVIRAHYWVTPGSDALKQAYGGALTLEQLRTLRQGLLEVLEALVKGSVQISTNDGQVAGLHEDDVQARQWHDPVTEMIQVFCWHGTC